ncbi:unnamed protein product [Sphagnum balticum]
METTLEYRQNAGKEVASESASDRSSSSSSDSPSRQLNHHFADQSRCYGSERQEHWTPTKHSYTTESTFCGSEPEPSLLDLQNHYRTVEGLEMEGLTLIDPSELEIQKKVAEGGEGRVYHAFWKSHGRNRWVVVKVLKRQIFDMRSTNSLMSQLQQVMMALGRRTSDADDDEQNSSRQHICEVLGVCHVKKDSGSSVCVQEKSEIWIIMERAASGDLRTLLDLSGENRILNHHFQPGMLMMCSIAMGMEDMHAAGLLHRDLKASNILLTVRRHIRPREEGDGVHPEFDKVLDLKWVAIIGDYGTSEDVIGTGFWRAPEVLQALKDGVKPELTRKADVYSFAMLCWELLTGQIPFAGHSLSDYNHILEWNNRPELPPDLPEGLSQLIKRCWQTIPQERPEFSEIVQILQEECSKISDHVFIDALSSLSFHVGPRTMLVAMPKFPECISEMNSTHFISLKY